MNGKKNVEPIIDFQALSNLLKSASRPDTYYAIVNAPFANKLQAVLLYLGFICLYILDEKSKEVCLVAVSGTEEYHLSIEGFKFDPADYRLSFGKDKNNQIIKAIISETQQCTTDWTTLNRGDTPEETVRLNQANSGIACTVIEPFVGPIRGALMFNYYQYREKLGAEQVDFMKQYFGLVSDYLVKRQSNIV